MSATKARDTAWDYVNSPEFTQMRKHGYGRSYIDTAVRSALGAARPQMSGQIDSAGAQMMAGGMENSGMLDRLPGHGLDALVRTAMGAEGQAAAASDQARMGAEGQYVNQMASKDQMDHQMQIHRERMAHERKKQKTGWMGKLAMGLSLASYFVPGGAAFTIGSGALGLLKGKKEEG